MNENYNYNTPDSLGIHILEKVDVPTGQFSMDDSEKLAFNLTVTPGAVIGSLVGAGVFNKRQKEIKDRQRIMASSPGRQGVPAVKKKDNPSIKGNYYAQASSLAQHLKVAFTPVSAIYLVKNGTKDVAIETIDVEKMDDTMHAAWQNKDEEFFKRMLLNKMMMEVGLAERVFARNAISNQNLINQSLARRNGLSKTASFSCDAPDEYLESILSMRTMYEEVGCGEKIAQILERNAGDPITVSIGFDGCPEKYASLGKAEEVLSINSSTNHIRSLKKRLEDPGYLKKNVGVGFLPDRVAFTVDNTLVTTLSVFDMNNDGFRAFQDQDSKYFKKLFRNSMKSQGYQKTAAEQEEVRPLKVPKAIAFRMNEVNPVVYDRILAKKYGQNWTDIDLPAIIKMIEVDFKLSDSGIPDIPLNKIMSIYTCFSQETLNAFMRPLAFEKIIRSFNDLPIDFLRPESDGIGVNELVYGIYVYEKLLLRKGADVYELFSDEIAQYIAELLYSKDVVVLLPIREDASEEHLEFYSDINRRVLDMLESKNTLDSMDAQFESTEEKKEYKNSLYQNEILQPLTLEVLTAIRSGKVSGDLTQEYIGEVCEKYEFDMNKENLLRRQIQINLDVDSFMKEKISELGAQIALYSL